MMLLHVFFLYHTHTHTYTHICRWHSNQKTKWESVSEKKIQIQNKKHIHTIHLNITEKKWNRIDQNHSNH